MPFRPSFYIRFHGVRWAVLTNMELFEAAGSVQWATTMGLSTLAENRLSGRFVLAHIVD